MEKQPRPVKVKNKNPAPVQITAEQILFEAKERQEPLKPVPRQKITDSEELAEYRLRKRKEFEDAIRRNKNQVGNWLKYASWEESQHEHERARSIYERGVGVDPRNQTLWLKYAEMEMKHRNINHARNIFDRAVAVLPRVDMFWYKYTYMEELLDNIAGARQVFERWMQWEPGEEAWMAYVKFEQRYRETDRAREIFRRFVDVHPYPKNWLKWAKFEESTGGIDRARTIYEQCIGSLGEEFIDQNVYVSFAKFETRVKEIDRARVIYKFALERLPKGQAENLYNAYMQFEKQFGAKEGIEDVVVGKRRAKYEEELASNSRNYDAWFDYARLEESAGDPARIREVYERAIAQVPLLAEKRFWRRYIYIWLFYAVWEEIVAKDYDRAKEVYTQCLKLVPHKTFTFSKVWLQYARFLIRRMDITAARKTLGMAIGLCPKEKLFKGYIELELQLREFDRVRALYEKYLAWNPANCYAWIKYAELERMLGDTERSRGIFEIAVEQGVLDMPEVLWKGYIDFEVGESEWERARDLYERLLQRTEHVKVWISYATFENTALDNGEEPASRAQKMRSTFERAYTLLKRKGLKEERMLLLEAWRDLEKEVGDEESIKKVVDRMPRVVKKRRKVEAEDGEGVGVGGAAWEEYYDYIFPDDETDRPNFKLLAMAHQWKLKMAEMQGKGVAGAANDDDDDDSSDEDSSDEEEGGDNGSGKGEAVGSPDGEKNGKDNDDDDDESDNNSDD
ncbi:Crooked neck-like protein 1 [Quaeritorhiza haematococci]|nr:Crooked neck-like protein 1 [Quaeritorhiza haematococci]